MCLLNNIGAIQLGALAAILALLLSDDLEVEELNVLGNFSVGLGSIILIVAAQKEFLSAKQEKAAKKEEEAKGKEEKPKGEEGGEGEGDEAEVIRHLKLRIEKLEQGIRSLNPPEE